MASRTEDIRITRLPAAPRTVAVAPCCPPSMMRTTPWRVEDFELHKQLYKGKASLLYSATCRLSQLPVALKLYRKARLSELNWFQVTREITIHSQLEHAHIIALYAAFEDDEHVYLAQEFATGGDLYEELKRCGGQLRERRLVADVLQPCLSALHYLHSKGIIHRDIKPENILLAERKEIKLADFGLSINAGQERPVTRAGTLDYMAPEVLVCPEKSRPEENKERVLLGYTDTVDAWAVGILAYELLIGHPPFERETRAETYQQIMYRKPSYPPWVGDEARTFINTALVKVLLFFLLKAIVKAARKRPSVEDLLDNAWLALHPRGGHRKTSLKTNPAALLPVLLGKPEEKRPVYNITADSSSASTQVLSTLPTEGQGVQAVPTPRQKVASPTVQSPQQAVDSPRGPAASATPQSPSSTSAQQPEEEGSRTEHNEAQPSQERPGQDEGGLQLMLHWAGSSMRQLSSRLLAKAGFDVDMDQGAQDAGGEEAQEAGQSANLDPLAALFFPPRHLQRSASAVSPAARPRKRPVPESKAAAPSYTGQADSARSQSSTSRFAEAPADQQPASSPAGVPSTLIKAHHGSKELVGSPHSVVSSQPGISPTSARDEVTLESQGKSQDLPQVDTVSHAKSTPAKLRLQPARLQGLDARSMSQDLGSMHHKDSLLGLPQNLQTLSPLGRRQGGVTLPGGERGAASPEPGWHRLGQASSDAPTSGGR